MIKTHPNHFNCEIKIKGRLDEGWAEWFDGLAFSYESDDTTTISGSLPDQAALHSILLKIRDMNLTLISVTKVNQIRKTDQTNYSTMEVAKMKQNTSFISFTGRMIVAHFLTYFMMGLLFYVSGLNVIAYYEQHPQAEINTLFRDTSSLLVTAGPFFQLLRGFIFALALYPFRTVFLERKFGWLYLWGIFLAFAILAPSSAAPGSIEGYVYTTFPISFHLIYLPEIILQTFAFSWLFVAWEKRPRKKLSIPLVILFFLILLMNGFPVIQYLLN